MTQKMCDLKKNSSICKGASAPPSGHNSLDFHAKALPIQIEATGNLFSSDLSIYTLDGHFPVHHVIMVINFVNSVQRGML